MTLIFNPLRAMVVTRTREKIKVKGGQVVQKLEWRQTDGRTRRSNFITFRANAVRDKINSQINLRQ